MGAPATAAVEGGLADPVFDAQAIFRALMGAMAEPGTVADLGTRVAAPAPLVPAAAAVLAALADGDTPVFLAEPEGAGEAAARWLRFQTGAPVTADPARAAFAVLPEGDDPAGWTRFPRGTPDYPDRSATLLLPVRALSRVSYVDTRNPAQSDEETKQDRVGGSTRSCLEGGAPLVLTGPGIPGERRVAPRGLPEGFVAAMARNRAGFPLGVDLVLVCGTAVLALPRSTRIREG